MQLTDKTRLILIILFLSLGLAVPAYKFGVIVSSHNYDLECEAYKVYYKDTRIKNSLSYVVMMNWLEKNNQSHNETG